MPEFAEPGRLRLAFFELKLCSDDARRAATRAMANAAVKVETLLKRLERETGTRAVSFSLRGVDVDRDGRLLKETRDDDARLASVGECFSRRVRGGGRVRVVVVLKKQRRDRKGKGFERGAGEVADESRDGRDGVRDAERRGNVRRVFRDEARDFGRFEIKEVRLSKSREFDVALGGYFVRPERQPKGA